MTSAIKASDGIIRFWATGDDTAYRRWGERMAEQRSAEGMGTPETLLALSGGSDKGAFAAGLLNGWTRRGDRPSFDIVTGVSTGALIAPFAFLGSSQDATLTQIYTGISAKDVFRQRVLHGLFGGSSLLSSKPLSALIARYVTEAFLDRIAEQHRRGRRLLVMTTQLDAERGVIWDMGAIAASTSPHRLALFRQILLASASIPGAFPPVLISANGEPGAVAEMHVDGGTIAGFFTLPRALLTMSPQTRGHRAIYVIYNGRLAPEFEVTKLRTFAVLSRALSTVLGESDRTNIDDLRKFAGSRDIRFIVCAMMTPTTDRKAPPFDTMHMREMYREGDEEGTSSRGCLSGDK